MYICLCQGVTDTAIRRAVDQGVETVAELSMKTGAGTRCGSCVPMAREIMEERLAERDALPAAINLRVVCAS